MGFCIRLSSMKEKHVSREVKGNNIDRVMILSSYSFPPHSIDLLLLISNTWSSVGASHDPPYRTIHISDLAFRGQNNSNTRSKRIILKKPSSY